jgi:ketosteroid isomerase-like protein
MALKPRVKTTGDRFRASVDIPILGGAKTETLTIRQDSRLRRVHPNDDLLDALEGILDVQAAAWNRGDIDGFMEHYWKSDELTFSSGGKTTRGWQTTKDNYKLRYPTRERMGHLTFDQLEVFPLGDTAALLLGHWHLDRNGPVGGNFSLVFRKFDGAWVIVHDHTSRKE